MTAPLFAPSHSSLVAMGRKRSLEPGLPSQQAAGAAVRLPGRGGNDGGGGGGGSGRRRQRRSAPAALLEPQQQAAGEEQQQHAPASQRDLAEGASGGSPSPGGGNAAAAAVSAARGLVLHKLLRRCRCCTFAGKEPSAADTLPTALSRMPSVPQETTMGRQRWKPPFKTSCGGASPGPAADPPRRRARPSHTGGGSSCQRRGRQVGRWRGGACSRSHRRVPLLRIWMPGRGPFASGSSGPPDGRQCSGRSD